MKTQHEPLLDIKNLRVRFHTDTGLVKAVEGLNLSLAKGEALGLVLELADIEPDILRIGDERPRGGAVEAVVVVAVDGKVEIRPMMYLALSYDHRVVDGKEAVTFLIRIKDCIENPARMLVGA